VDAAAKAEVGLAAPEFALEGTGGRTWKLDEHRGRWVVLAFYPGDFTTVCTRQFCSYRDDDAKLAALDAEVVGISPQSVESHDRFTAEHELTVPLLADTEKDVARAYGVLGPGGFVRRAIFIVDPAGVVRHRDVSLVGLRYRTVDQIGRELAALRSKS
jgi:thioredoxin-dependent peroxiredoxin